MNGREKVWQSLKLPCYHYDRAEVLRRIGLLKAALDGFTPLYSVKANPFKDIVSLMGKQGFGSDVASSNEVLLSLDCGIPAEKIYFSAPGKRLEDLEKIVGRCTIIADSLDELGRIEVAAAGVGLTVEIGLRVNPRFTMDGGMDLPSKFGIDEELMGEAMEIVAGLPHVKVTGLHIHVKSQVLDTEALARYYPNCFRLARELAAAYQIDLRFLNFGSGIGTVYDDTREKPVDLDRIREVLAEIRRENEETLGAKLLIESGRFAVSSAGTYYTEIVDIKESRGTKFLVVKGGMNAFVRPAMAVLLGGPGKLSQEPFYTTDNAFRIRVENDAAEQERVTVAGDLCCGIDVFGRDLLLNRARVGDVISVSNAGSYACTLSPQLFAGHDAPAQYLL